MSHDCILSRVSIIKKIKMGQNKIISQITHAAKDTEKKKHVPSVAIQTSRASMYTVCVFLKF